MKWFSIVQPSPPILLNHIANGVAHGVAHGVAPGVAPGVLLYMHSNTLLVNIDTGIYN